MTHPRDLRTLRRPFALALVGLLGVAGLTLTPTPARADTETVGDLVYQFTPGMPGATVSSYGGAGGAVAIPSSVTLGGDPYDVVAIGDNAFEARGITSFTLPPTVTSIGFRAFFGNALTSLALPSTVTSLGNYAFSMNPGLTTVSVPGSIAVLPPSLFSGSGVVSVTLGEGIATISNGVFYGTSVSSITIPASVTSIGYYAFRPAPAQTVVFEGDAPSIDADAFSSGGAALYFRAGATGFTTPTTSGYPTRQLGAIAFDANGGVGVMAATEAASTLPSNSFTRAGHTFTGWNTAADGSGTAVPDGAWMPPTGDPSTLYAQWQRNAVAGIVVAGPGEIDELEPVTLAVAGRDAHNDDLGSIAGEVALTHPTATITGLTIEFPFDPATVGGTRWELVPVSLIADPQIGLRWAFLVHSAATALRLDLPATVAEGGSLTATVWALDADGNVLGEVTDHVTLTSNVPTDIVTGPSVRFPTASPHTITATAASGLTVSAVVNVIPTPVATGALAATGADGSLPLALALSLLAMGALALSAARRGRRTGAFEV